MDLYRERQPRPAPAPSLRGPFDPPHYLNAAAIGRPLKKLATRAGLDPIEAAFRHSLRVGAAQQLTLNGVQILPIMRAGGWRSFNAVARYIENVEMDVWTLGPGP